MSAAMATRDATSKDKDPGAAAESGNGAESTSDVPGGEEIGFGEVKHGLPDAKTCHTVLSKMMLIRRFEERAGEMYAKAKIGGFLHLCIGEEATIVGATQALKESDYLMSTYREHGQALARGTDPNAVMAELFGREGGVSKGRGGSMHLFDWERRFLGGYGIVGGSLPLSAGVALACDYLETEDAILSMMGDGATNQGTFGETMNLAALWKLPVVFLIINNQFGMGTALHRHSAVTDLSLKSEGFGVPGTRCDGMDVLDVHAVVTESLKCARDERKPQLVEAVTYRYRGHSMADPEEYRSKEEVEEWRERDPIKAFAKRLVDEGVLEEDEVEQMDEEAIERVDEAQRFADESPFPDLDSLYDDVYVFSDEVPTWWTVDERSPEVHRGEREREAGEIPHELAEKGAAYAGVGDRDARKRRAPKDQDEEGEQQGPGEDEEEGDAKEAEATGEGDEQEAEDETEASAQKAEAKTEQGEEEEGQEDEAEEVEASAEASGTGEPEADERDETGGGG
jgi:pyruvate dehydrogenase E1 component alpha subunit